MRGREKELKRERVCECKCVRKRSKTNGQSQVPAEEFDFDLFIPNGELELPEDDSFFFGELEFFEERGEEL